MNKNSLILIIVLSLYSVPNGTFVSAAEREYIVPMEKSKWLSSAKEKHECSLSQIIPFYGKGQFSHKSGHKVTFTLSSDEPVLVDNVKVIVQSEPPPWRHDDKVFEIAQYDFTRGHEPLVVRPPHASRMLQQVENGMSPVVIYRDMADGRDIIAVLLSPVNFREALAEYRECEKTLMDFNINEIKELKLYFASNKDILSARSRRDLNNVIRYLKMDPGILQIKIDAYADSRGRRRFNDKLSQRRSEAVKKFLLSAGAKATMLYSVNHGERESDYTNDTVQGRAKNRRVDVHLLTTAPPTAAEQEAIEAARKAERRRQLTERSIFNQKTLSNKESVDQESANQKKTELEKETNKFPQSNAEASTAPDNEQTAAVPMDNELDDEPPAPNFINLDHLVDKNNQKIKSR